MALRDKLRASAQPYLEPGEQLDEVMLAQAGPSPWSYLGFLFGVLLGLVAVWAMKPLIIAVTDRSVVVLRGSRLRPSRAKALQARLPRQTRLGPPSSKLWSKLDLYGQRVWVHRRFAKNIAAADAPLLAPPPPSPAPAATPQEQDYGSWRWGAARPDPSAAATVPAPPFGSPLVDVPVDAPPVDAPPVDAPLPSSSPAAAGAPVTTGRWPIETRASKIGQAVLAVVAVLVVIVVSVGTLGANNEKEARQRIEAYIEDSGRHQFFAADGRFRAEFPGAPVRSTHTEMAAGVTLETVIYQREVGLDTTFVVSYVDLPFPPPDPTGALNGAANGAAVASNGEVLSATPTTVGGRQALETVISLRVDGGTTDVHYSKVLIVLDGARLYTAGVIDKNNPPAGYDSFAPTFEIVPG